MKAQQCAVLGLAPGQRGTAARLCGRCDNGPELCLQPLPRQSAFDDTLFPACHQIIGGVDDESLKALRYLTEHEGISSFKLFMAYPGVFLSSDGQIVQAMQQAAGNGAMIMMHAENGSAIDVLIAQALAEGKTDPKYHSLTRPWETEAEATNRAIMLARMEQIWFG